MSSIQNSKKFRERADLLQEQAALHGITMVPGEAAELLGNRLTAVADQMGISERWALDNYVTDPFVISLVEAIAEQAKTYREVVEQTEPLTLTIAETARVLAAIGMALKLATEHADQTKANSMAVLTDGADAIVNIGATFCVMASGPARAKALMGLIRPARWYKDLPATSASLAAGALQDPPSCNRSAT